MLFHAHHTIFFKSLILKGMIMKQFVRYKWKAEYFQALSDKSAGNVFITYFESLHS